MSYTLKLTNGTILLTLADQQSDSVTTSLTLIGKNVNAYGTDLNDNFIHLLENFSNSTAPTNPLVGQLWFDRAAQQIKVYTDSLQFKPVGGPIISATTPTGLVAGDLWIDTTNKQFNYYDGTEIVLVGPSYSATLGNSGVIVSPIPDVNGVSQPISIIYSGGAVLGTISSSTFTPRLDALQNLGGIQTVYAGITAAPGIKFYGTATNTDSIGDIQVSDLLLSTDSNPQTFVGQLGIYNDDGLTIGTNEDISLYVNRDSRATTLALGNIQDCDFFAKTSTTAAVHCLHYSSSTGYLGFFNGSPEAPIDIIGDVKITGNLDVLGTSTYIYAQDLRITDVSVELAYGNTSDTIANGGGLTLHGTTNKTLSWLASSQSWRSSENIDLNAGLTYKINGQTVISGNALGTGITSAPGLATLTGLQSVTIGQIAINTSTIGMINSVPLTIGTGATTEVDFNGIPLRNLYTALPGGGDSLDTAATIGYVQDAINTNISGNYSLQIDVTGYAASSADINIDNFIVAALNNYLLPPADSSYTIKPGARARIMATRTSTSSTNAVSNAIGFAPVSVYQAGTSSPVNVIVDDRPYTAMTTFPSIPVIVDRVVKEYRVNASSQWQAYPAGAGANIVHVYGSW